MRVSPHPDLGMDGRVVFDVVQNVSLVPWVAEVSLAFGDKDCYLQDAGVPSPIIPAWTHATSVTASHEWTEAHNDLLSDQDVALPLLSSEKMERPGMTVRVGSKTVRMLVEG